MSILEHPPTAAVQYPGNTSGSDAPLIDYPLTSAEASLLALAGRVAVVVEITASDLADDAAGNLHRLACNFGTPTHPGWTVLGHTAQGTYLVEYSTALHSEF